MKGEVVKLHNNANQMSSIVRSSYIFIATVKCVVNFTAAFKREHGVFFLAG